MTLTRITTTTEVIKATIRKHSFIGLFRFGPKIQVDIKVCCDSYGKITYYVLDGPKHLDYEIILKEEFRKAKASAIKKWNSQRRSRVVIKPKPIQRSPSKDTLKLEKKLEITRRSIDGIVKVDALIPKTEATPIPLKPYQKQKTIEYKETDISFGDTTKIYDHQTRTIVKNEQIL